MKKKFEDLCSIAEEFLGYAPEEDECTDEENEILAELANLYNALRNYGYDSKASEDDISITCDNIDINATFDKAKGDIFISHNNGSGAQYPCKTKEDMKNVLCKYVDLYIE